MFFWYASPCARGDISLPSSSSISCFCINSLINYLVGRLAAATSYKPSIFTQPHTQKCVIKTVVSHGFTYHKNQLIKFNGMHENSRRQKKIAAAVLVQSLRRLCAAFWFLIVYHPLRTDYKSISVTFCFFVLHIFRYVAAYEHSA